MAGAANQTPSPGHHISNTDHNNGQPSTRLGADEFSAPQARNSYESSLPRKVKAGIAGRLFAETGGLSSEKNWGARIRTWDHGTKTRCLTTWLRPNAASPEEYRACRFGTGPRSDASTGRPRAGARSNLQRRSENKEAKTTIASTTTATTTSAAVTSTSTNTSTPSACEAATIQASSLGEPVSSRRKSR